MTDPTDLIRRALLNIRELNMTPEDENGHRWANSDLIEQEVVAALTALSATAQEPVGYMAPDDGYNRYGSRIIMNRRDESTGHTVPLYTHPTPISDQPPLPFPAGVGYHTTDAGAGDGVAAPATVQESPSPGVTAGAMGLDAVVAFLCGEAPLDGVWFGDNHPSERGTFWWRKHLRAAIATPAPVVPAEGLEAAMERLQTEICCADGDRADAAQDHSDGSERVDLWPHTAEFDVDDVRMVLDALRSAPPVGARVTGWQPIETAPKDGTPVDLWCLNLLHHAKKGFRMTNVSWGTVTDWFGTEHEDWRHGRGEDIQPTHWMPLPEPPAALLPAGEGE